MKSEQQRYIEDVVRRRKLWKEWVERQAAELVPTTYQGCLIITTCKYCGGPR